MSVALLHQDLNTQTQIKSNLNPMFITEKGENMSVVGLLNINEGLKLFPSQAA